MFWISQYGYTEYYDGSIVTVCLSLVDTFWPAFYFVSSISVFFILPFLVLVVLYTVIARHLMNNPGITSHGNRSNVLKYRKQVIFMLGAVVISFFICLLPFRALYLWIIFMPPETITSLGIDGYYALLYFCRILLYINSALNPILYNLMSSKFREGFLRLLGCKTKVRHKLLSSTRKGTFHTTSTNLSSSQSGDKRRSGRIRDDSETITASIVIRNGIEDVLVISSDSDKIDLPDASRKINGFAKRKRSTFDDIEEIEENALKSPDEHENGTVKKRTEKEVLFCHQNMKNGCRMKKQHSFGDGTQTKTKLISVLVNKRDSSDSIDVDKCSVSDNQPKNGVKVTRVTDDGEKKKFLENEIGTESFV